MNEFSDWYRVQLAECSGNIQKIPAIMGNSFEKHEFGIHHLEIKKSMEQKGGMI